MVQDCATAIRKHGGAALFIDYGDDFASFDSFRGLKDHEFCDPLMEPGNIDLTADVDFAAIGRAVESLNSSPVLPSPPSSATKSSDAYVKPHGPVLQNELLKSLGIAERFEVLYARANHDEREALKTQYQRLMDTREMGRLYKALSVTCGMDGPPVAFSN